MFSRFELENVEFRSSDQFVELETRQIGQGLNTFEDFFAWRDGDYVKIYDRVCDHQGGRLISRGDEIMCPLHGWKLEPLSGKYKNANCEKEPIDVLNLNHCKGTISVKLPDIRRVLKNYSIEKNVSVEFINHACLLFTTDEFSFATDPWVKGPAFSNGWWLKYPSRADSIEKLNKCDFIFISHNHPDHLHPESLSEIRKDMPILTAPFSTGSTITFLKELGFSVIHTCGFNKRLADDERQISFSVLKSGDFRDDSGLLIELGNFSVLLNVDSNFIDFYRFPKSLTLLCSSFAGGASGFPLCFASYDEDEKCRIVSRNRNTLRAINSLMIQKAKPKFYLPYAGFFTEKAERDSYINDRNKKNTPQDYQEICTKNDIELIDILSTNHIEFQGNTIVSKSYVNSKKIEEKPVGFYIQKTKEQYSSVSDFEIENYFENSKFFRNLNLFVSLTDDQFDNTEKFFLCKFTSTENPRIRFFDPETAVYLSEISKRYLHIKVRKEEFIRVIKNGLPWEDLSIGFQCRVERHPNIYNSEFWYHFSNVYVSERVKRLSLNCDTCAKLQHQIV